MTTRGISIQAAIAIALLLVCSCAGGGPIAPSSPDLKTSVGDSVRTSGKTLLWGLWDIRFDPASETADVVPLRGVEFACNVNVFLQPPVVDKNLVMVDIDPASSDFAGGLVVADISITHPFPGMELLTGFDVRGVCIADASVAGVVDSGIRYSGTGDFKLLNSDGMTRWFNPTEFTSYNTLFGFTPGKGATPGHNFTGTLNGFRYFCDNLEKDVNLLGFFTDPYCLNPRGCFKAGSRLTRRYELQFPVGVGTGAYRLQYAVVASWQPPTFNPPILIPDDFPVSANCAEAYVMSTLDMSEMYYISDSDKGGTFRLMVGIFDHQGSVNPEGVAGEIGRIVVETPDGVLNGKTASFEGAALDAALVSQDEKSAIYMIETQEIAPFAEGYFPVLVGVESAQPGDYSSGFSGYAYPESARLVAYTTDRVYVKNTPDSGWAATWGGPSDDVAEAVAVDKLGNVYTTGDFYGSVDFDPGPGIDEHSSNGGYSYARNAFLSKFDSEGNYQWAVTWGGVDVNRSHGVAVDGSGNIYVAGEFYSKVDFDPGPGEDARTPVGYADAFLCKFAPDGTLIRALTWGGQNAYCLAYGVDISLWGDVCVAGWCEYTVDFDPGPGEEYAGGSANYAFLSRFDSSGNFRWVRTWGGTGVTSGCGVSCDDSGFSYVTGYFEGTCDFDPGDGIDTRSSFYAYTTDVFVSRFDSSGFFSWARTLGGSRDDCGYAVAADPAGDAYVTGHYSGNVDSAFAGKIDHSGHLKWLRTWGDGSGSYYYYNVGRGIVVGLADDVYVTGRFDGTVDLDPSDSQDIHSSTSTQDTFLSKFGLDGDFMWALTLCGNGWSSDYEDGGGRGLALGSTGAVFVAGAFTGTADFNPGIMSDIHDSNGSLDAYLTKVLPNGMW